MAGRDTSGTSLTYRPAVGIMLLNKRGRVFVAHRIDSGALPAWQMPQGGIDPGETPRQAAMRELEEEVGTAKAEIVAESRAWLSYDLPPALAGKLWGGGYCGQRQKWFAMRFTGCDADINLTGYHPEFDDWRWVPVDELPRLIVAFKRRLYIEIVAEFREHCRGAGRS